MAIVAHRLARGIDAAGQGRIGHDAAAPHRRDEIVLRDDAIAVLHNIDQQVEYLRLHCNGLPNRGATRAARCQAYDRQRQIARCGPHRTAGSPSVSISKSAKPGRLHSSRLRRGVVHGPIAERKAHSRRKNSGYLQKNSMPSAVRLQAGHPVRAYAFGYVPTRICAWRLNPPKGHNNGDQGKLLPRCRPAVRVRRRLSTIKSRSAVTRPEGSSSTVGRSPSWAASRRLPTRP